MARRPPPAKLIPYPALAQTKSGKRIPGAKGQTFLVGGTAPNEGPNAGRPLRGVNPKTGQPVYGPKRGGRRRALLGRMKG